MDNGRAPGGVVAGWLHSGCRLVAGWFPGGWCRCLGTGVHVGMGLRVFGLQRLTARFEGEAAQQVACAPGWQGLGETVHGLVRCGGACMRASTTSAHACEASVAAPPPRPPAPHGGCASVPTSLPSNNNNTMQFHACQTPCTCMCGPCAAHGGPCLGLLCLASSCRALRVCRAGRRDLPARHNALHGGGDAAGAAARRFGGAAAACGRPLRGAVRGGGGLDDRVTRHPLQRRSHPGAPARCPPRCVATGG